MDEDASDASGIPACDYVSKRGRSGAERHNGQNVTVAYERRHARPASSEAKAPSRTEHVFENEAESTSPKGERSRVLNESRVLTSWFAVITHGRGTPASREAYG